MSRLVKHVVVKERLGIRTKARSGTTRQILSTQCYDPGQIVWHQCGSLWASKQVDKKVCQ